MTKHQGGDSQTNGCTSCWWWLSSLAWTRECLNIDVTNESSFCYQNHWDQATPESFSDSLRNYISNNTSHDKWPCMKCIPGMVDTETTHLGDLDLAWLVKALFGPWIQLISVVLGLDFLRAHRCILDCDSCTLRVGSTVHTFHSIADMPACYTISMTKTMIVLSKSEMIDPCSYGLVLGFCEPVCALTKDDVHDGEKMFRIVRINLAAHWVVKKMSI